MGSKILVILARVQVLAMNRSLWLETISKTLCPAWPCPVCEKGTIALIQKSLTSEETVKSKQAHGHEAWDPDWIESTFTAWAECKHPSCKQKFSLAGKGSYSPEMKDNGDYDWEEYFVPMFCQPMPHIIEIPEKCPDKVREELTSSFELFLSNQAACAGRIRVALEYLMDHLGVPRKKKGIKGKYFDLSLHARIDLYASSDPAVSPHLVALKWLGNTGSHDSQVSKIDLLDAFEILEHALEEIIDKKSKKVAKLAKKLTKKHGH